MVVLVPDYLVVFYHNYCCTRRIYYHSYELNAPRKQFHSYHTYIFVWASISFISLVWFIQKHSQSVLLGYNPYYNLNKEVWMKWNPIQRYLMYDMNERVFGVPSTTWCNNGMIFIKNIIKYLIMYALVVCTCVLVLVLVRVFEILKKYVLFCWKIVLDPIGAFY